METLQEDLDNLYNWSNTWLLKFHPNKCKSVTISRQEPETRKYHLYDDNQNVIELEKTTGEKDIGVKVDEKLNYKSHIQSQINKANSIMGLIRRTYTHLDIESFKYLFIALVRPHLEYAAAVWNPHTKQDTEDIENVQRRATRQIPALKNMSYTERLKKLNLPTLKFRRIRGDLIETFKIVKGIYDPKVTQGLFHEAKANKTRGNEYKLEKTHCRRDVRKYSFTQRVVNIWNSLPNYIRSAPSTEVFKSRLKTYFFERAY